MTKPCDKPLYAEWLPCSQEGICQGAKIWGKKTSNEPCPWVDKCRNYYRERAGQLQQVEKVGKNEQKDILRVIKAFNGVVLGIERITEDG